MANGIADEEVEGRSVEESDNYDNNIRKRSADNFSAFRNGESDKMQSALSDVSKQNGGGLFGGVHIVDSTDILVGNKAILNGELTINQYFYPNEVKEVNQLTGNLPPLPESVAIKSKNGDIKLQNGVKPHPMLQITQQNSVEKGFVREWWRWLSCAFAGSLFVMFVLFFLLWWLPNTTTNPPDTQKLYPFEIPDNLTDDERIFLNGTTNRYYTRAEWAARPAREITTNTLPVKMVIIAHTATENCTKSSECISTVKSIQDFHMDARNWSDIAYNFLVSGNGDIFIGRGWDLYGSHTKGYNIGSISIAFIGTFTTLPPTNEQVQAAQILIKTGLILGKIDKDYDLYAHRQLINTDSPGIYVYNIIKTWPHWKKI